jgi:hypothetical protein
VERLVPIPIAALLEPGNYGVYLLDAEWDEPPPWGEGPVSFPCFVHQDDGGREVLWGATYHIVLTFLDRVFDFVPPPVFARPTLAGTLSSTYVTGQRFRG